MIEIKRKTKETDITLSFEPYGGGQADISTGVGFFDHMLTSFCLHGGFDMALSVKGDVEVDCHHTIEDTGIVLGEAIKRAMGDKGGIARFGHSLVPMDEALCEVALDLSGRSYLVYEAPPMAPMIGDYDSEMTEEFLRALSVNGGITLHAELRRGKNAHHMTEALYKALARALKSAMAKTGEGILSAKGVLQEN